MPADTKVSEKSLELNVGAELLNLMRGPWGMPKAHLRGLTQREEKQQGVDFFVQLNPSARIFGFQFKAPRGSYDSTPYRYTLLREQHDVLHNLARGFPNAVFYVLPFYVTHSKLQRDVPNLMTDTWFLSVASMATAGVFGSNHTKVVFCKDGAAFINPEYHLERSSNLKVVTKNVGVPPREFAAWYLKLRRNEIARVPREKRMSPWLVRGLRVAIVES